jgi:hypothetical protein
VLAAAACLSVLSALMLGPWRWLHLNTLFDDWIFARNGAFAFANAAPMMYAWHAYSWGLLGCFVVS